ncbi:hypothetical protein ABGF48_03255 [Helcococcus bovis]|uniref:phage tail protein n=1 Tax=Helcococcus bovis TaxID=3153252 RepID=UPI0038B9BEA3
MNETLAELQVIIEAQTAGLKKELESVKRSTKNLATDVQRQTSNISKSFTGMGNKLKKLAIVAMLVKVGKEAINAAASLQEVENVVDVSFGNLRHYVDEFAENSIKQFGMSELVAKRTASIYMSMSKGMGLTGKAAAQMSINVAKMSGDLASFYDIEQSVADTALKSIWTGETETLKRFGVVMTQVNLQQFAYRQGIQKNIQDMSQQEQTLLRYKYVMESLSNAQGDFARTSNSWSNQVRLLKEQFKQLLSIIGQGLIQVLIPVLRLINTILAGLILITKKVASAFKKIFGLGSQTAEPKKNLEQINAEAQGIGIDGAKGLDNLGKSAKKAGKEAKGALASFDELNVLSSQIAEPTNVGGGSVSSSNGLGNFEVPDLYAGMNKGPELDTSWADKYVDTIVNVLTKVAEFAKKNKALQDTWNKISSLFTNIFNDIKKVFQDFWTNYGQPIMESLKQAWQSWVGFVEALWNSVLKPIIDTITVALQTLWDNILKPMLELSLTLIGEITTIILKLWNDVLAPFLTWILKVFAPLIKLFLDNLLYWWNVLLSGIKPIIDGIKSVIKGISTVLKGVIDFVSGVFTLNWSKAWNGIKDIFGGVFDTLKAIVKGLWDSIVNIFSGVANWFDTRVITPIVEAFTSGFSFIGNFISDVWHGILGLFSKGGKIFSGIAEGIGNVFVAIVNGLIDGINWVIGAPFRFINGILNKIGDINILGYHPFSFLSGDVIPVPQIPHLDVGTNYVARDGLAYIHEGEAVVPKKYNPALAGNVSNEEELSLLREQNRLLSLLLDKDTDIYLDGDKLHDNNDKKARQLNRRLGYA